MTDTPLTDSAALLWEESRRQIERQEADLNGLRLRAVGLLSVAALVAGFFGSHIASGSDHPRHTVIAVICALALFGVGVIAVVIVIVPKRSAWSFSENLGQYFDLLKAGTITPVDVTANLAEKVKISYDENQVHLESLYNWFGFACVLVGLQVIAWGIAAI